MHNLIKLINICEFKQYVYILYQKTNFYRKRYFSIWNKSILLFILNSKWCGSLYTMGELERTWNEGDPFP